MLVDTQTPSCRVKILDSHVPPSYGAPGEIIFLSKSNQCMIYSAKGEWVHLGVDTWHYDIVIYTPQAPLDGVLFKMYAGKRFKLPKNLEGSFINVNQLKILLKVNNHLVGTITDSGVESDEFFVEYGDELSLIVDFDPTSQIQQIPITMTIVTERY